MTMIDATTLGPADRYRDHPVRGLGRLHLRRVHTVTGLRQRHEHGVDPHRCDHPDREKVNGVSTIIPPLDWSLPRYADAINPTMGMTPYTGYPISSPLPTLPASLSDGLLLRRARRQATFGRTRCRPERRSPARSTPLSRSASSTAMRPPPSAGDGHHRQRRYRRGVTAAMLPPTSMQRRPSAASGHHHPRLHRRRPDPPVHDDSCGGRGQRTPGVAEHLRSTPESSRSCGPIHFSYQPSGDGVGTDSGTAVFSTLP